MQDTGVPACKENAVRGGAGNFIQGFANGQLVQVNSFTAVEALACKAILFFVGAAAVDYQEKKQAG